MASAILNQLKPWRKKVEAQYARNRFREYNGVLEADLRESRANALKPCHWGCILTSGLSE